jgi:hypothetical protein
MSTGSISPADASLTYLPFRQCLADGLAGRQQVYADLAEQSKTVRLLSPLELPGELQTEAWMRSVFSYNPGFTDDDQRRDIDAATAARQARAALLTTGESEYHLLTSTIPLRYRRTWPQLGEQIEHLIHAAAATQFRLGLIPDGAPTRMTPYQAVTLYDRRLVEVETYSGMLYLSDPEDFAANERAFEEFARSALYGHDAIAELHRLRAELLG